MKKLQNKELEKLLDELSDMLQEVYRDKLKAVILYGSAARGTATIPDSIFDFSFSIQRILNN